MAHMPIARPSWSAVLGDAQPNDDTALGPCGDAVVRGWSNSNCDDPQAQCAAQEDAVGDVGRLGPECLLGDVNMRVRRYRV